MSHDITGDRLCNNEARRASLFLSITGNKSCNEDGVGEIRGNIIKKTLFLSIHHGGDKNGIGDALF